MVVRLEVCKDRLQRVAHTICTKLVCTYAYTPRVRSRARCSTGPKSISSNTNRFRCPARCTDLDPMQKPQIRLAASAAMKLLGGTLVVAMLVWALRLWDPLLVAQP